MLKRTLYFGNPAYLSMQNGQLLVRLPEVDKDPEFRHKFRKEAEAIIPIEDVGYVILDHSRIVLSHALMAALEENNIALISCNSRHLPAALMLPLDGHTLQNERYRAQLDASVPLKKNLWQQTIQAKISNQAALLKKREIEHDNMLYWARSVKTGDRENHESRAAAYYWSVLFAGHITKFIRGRDEAAPNNLLNYGYAILRAVVARALVSTGLNVTYGIHHHNRYNAYCLADDIMEPYRPFVDELVVKLMQTHTVTEELTTELKRELLTVPVVDTTMDGEKSPLMHATHRTAASLVRCFEGVSRKIIYPEFS